MPRTKVSLKAFYIDKFEVTNAHYNEFISQTGYPPPYNSHDLAKPYNWSSGTFPPGTANYPVVLVSWEDAFAYARWAGKRLPLKRNGKKPHGEQMAEFILGVMNGVVANAIVQNE